MNPDNSPVDVSFKPIRIERLSRVHLREHFSCGEPSLDNYLTKLALQHDERRIGRTFVAIAPIWLVAADISTVSGAADKVLIMDGPDASVIHLEGFAAWGETILLRAMFYNGPHHRRHFPLPVVRQNLANSAVLRYPFLTNLRAPAAANWMLATGVFTRV